MGPTQPPMQWVLGSRPSGVKRHEREADHSPPTSAEDQENEDLYLHSPIRLHGVVLNKLNTGTILPFYRAVFVRVKAQSKLQPTLLLLF
jgi:hypothetical protein